MKSTNHTSRRHSADTPKLTPRQEVFVREYLVDLNAAQAAIRAGFSKKTAKQQASRLLTIGAVAVAIQTAMDKRANKLEIAAERVLQELALIAFANMMDYITITPNGDVKVDLSKLTREQAAAIGEITVEEFTERTGEDDDGRPIFENVKRTKFKLRDKRAALVDLGRHLKLFTDKVEVQGDFRVEVQDVRQKLLAKLAGRAA